MKYKEKMDSKELTEIFFKNLNEKISHQIEEINSILSKHQLKIDNNLNFDEIKKILEFGIDTIVSNKLKEVIMFIESYNNKIDYDTFVEIQHKLEDMFNEKHIIGDNL